MIEIDRCGFCGLTWFDRDELEMLQYMVENRLAGGDGGGAVIFVLHHKGTKAQRKAMQKSNFKMQIAK